MIQVAIMEYTNNIRDAASYKDARSEHRTVVAEEMLFAVLSSWETSIRSEGRREGMEEAKAAVDGRRLLWRSRMLTCQENAAQDAMNAIERVTPTEKAPQ
jgi:hypothetical protein